MSVNNVEALNADATDSAAQPIPRTFSNTRMAELNESSTTVPRRFSDYKMNSEYNPIPQAIEKPRSIELTTLVQTIARAKAVHDRLINFEGPEQVRALAHEERVERVIGHIVQNAIEASDPDSGVVSIRVFSVENRAVLEIRDEGCGMSEDFIRTQLFHPFQTTKRQGMGIGMYESFEYVNSIGGSISVESKLGVGTRFSVFLPLAKSTPAFESSPRSMQ